MGINFSFLKIKRFKAKIIRRLKTNLIKRVFVNSISKLIKLVKILNFKIIEGKSKKKRFYYILKKAVKITSFINVYRKT
ncbi:hypothetical protein D0809_07310 [Flavobacterium circumlabens]|uniref:Uncharacterized protein n=1 Tax=Flavobacterium circumlabens TaxID=2133765 RepID=A0A4Y7UGK6_9FLAO|nr:hypothetical protein D0809_07310 [Flavobacterium circumlabens]